MNRLLFWNDDAPLNCQEIIDYAQSRGVKVVLGFAWGWEWTALIQPVVNTGFVKDDVLCRFGAQ